MKYLFSVNFPVVAGGFALLASTATVAAGQAATASLLPSLLAPLGLVGVLGTAGITMMAMTECGGPTRCLTSYGQCCFLLLSIRGAVCPALC